MVNAGFDDKVDILESNNIYINEVYTVDSKKPTEESISEFTELFDDDSFKKELLDLKKEILLLKLLLKD